MQKVRRASQQQPHSLPDNRHSHGIKLVRFVWVEAHTHAPCLGVDGEGCLEQMVEAFSHVDVQTRVSVLQNDLRQQVLLQVLLVTLREEERCQMRDER